MWTVLLMAACGKTSPRETEVCGPDAARVCYEEGKSHLRGQSPQFDLATAAASFEVGCNGGHAEACLELGLLAQDGRGIPQDYDKAQVLYRKVCDAGYGVGCLNLAFMHQLGNGVPADEARAQGLVQEALDRFQAECYGTAPRYCANLGYILENGFGVTLVDTGGAMRAYERGCTGGDADACVNAMQLGLEKGKVQPKEALATLDERCKAGGAVACGALGQLYWGQRFGMERDSDKAISLLSRGCELGEAQSCLSLGALYGLGEGVAPLPDRVDTAMRRACWLGKIDGCMVVASTALSGWQEGKDAAQAKIAGEFLGNACRIGDAGACTAFGALVLQGALGPVEPELALQAFREACRRLDYGACVELVRAGRPLPLIEPQSSEFLAVACKQGNAEACTLAGLSPEDPSGNAPSP